MNAEFIKSQEAKLLTRQKKYKKLINSNKPPMHAHLKITTSLKYIKIALNHIRKGIYGTCIDCEGQILQKRLESVPGAIRCITCQTQEEQKG